MCLSSYLRRPRLFQVLSEAFKDSDPATPIYFILSAGANVTADVDKLADKHSMERGSTYHDISLGQVGPDPSATICLNSKLVSPTFGLILNKTG